MTEEFKFSLIRYITGQSDETESAEVREWIRAKPENEDYYFQLYEAWHAGLYAEKEIIDVDAAFAKVLNKTARVGSVTRRLNYFFRYAAAAIIVAIGVAGFLKYNNNKPAESLVELSVPKGQTKKITLPDGSSVWVNAGSSITYSKGFGKENRDVFLQGEAYFDIAKTDSDIPFLVKTDKFTIHDVGTIFNVKAYPDEDTFETTVVEGKVSVEGKLTKNSDANSQVFLEANQVLKIKSSGKSSAAAKTDVADPVKVMQVTSAQLPEYNGWRDDILVFDDDSFEDISKILERRYNIAVLFESQELKKYRYSGTFKNVKDVSKVFEVIKENTPIDYKLDEALVTIVKASN